MGGGGSGGIGTPAHTAAVAEQEAELLSLLAAAHAHCVLAAALERLRLLALVAVDPRSQPQDLAASSGEDVPHLLDEQRALESRFAELAAVQPQLRTAANKAPLQSNQAQLAQVTVELRAATKRLCSSLRLSPSVSDKLAKAASQRDALCALLASLLRCLAAGPTHSAAPLIEAVLSADRAEAEQREVAEDERGVTALVKALKGDVTAARAQHEHQMGEQRRALAEIKEQLRQQELTLAVQSRLHGMDAAAGGQAARRMAAGELAALQAQLTSVEQQLELERALGAADADALAARAAELQRDAAGWHSRREDDATLLERRIEAVRAAHARGQQRLEEAQGRLREEVAAKVARDARAREAAEEAAAAAVLAERHAAAATRIQASWRGHVVRRGGPIKQSRAAKKGVAKNKKEMRTKK